MSSKNYFDFLSKLEKDASFCYDYLQRNSFDKSHPTYQTCLKTISQNAKYAREFAENVIKGRFLLGEPAIATDPEQSFYYAYSVINGRFELGEPAIAKNSSIALRYATRVVKGRFELGEPAIAQDENYAYQYAIEVMKGKLPEEMHNVMLAKQIEAA